MFRVKYTMVSTLSPTLVPFIGIIVTCLAALCSASCRFPAAWTGHWFQSGFQGLIHIQQESMSFKGNCIQSEGDKFLLEDRRDSCFRCVVIHEKHSNVLQYKETYCSPPDTLEKLCASINGDAQLFSMFRVNASPVSCPFHGTFTFSYNRGNGECRMPMSTVDLCTEESRLLLKYQACPDVQGTESTVEELVCLAIWKEGSTRFLVGKLEHSLANSREDKYRCFIYEDLEDESGFLIAQSGDATCVGLFSPIEGSRTMRLTKDSSASALCEFPSWVTHASVWHTLDAKTTYIFDPSTNATLNVTDTARKTTQLYAICTEKTEKPVAADRQATVIVHATVGCNNGYMCLVFFKRQDHVIEMQKGTMARNLEEACSPAHFDEASAEFITLLPPSPKAGRCPYLGKYTIVSLHKNPRKDIRDTTCVGFNGISAGCDGNDAIEFQPSCPQIQRSQTYHCHGSWEENGTNYLITSLKGSKSKFCFIYVEVDSIVKLSSVKESCNRRIQPGINGVMAFNITIEGDCQTVAASEARRTIGRCYGTLFTLIAMLYFTR